MRADKLGDALVSAGFDVHAHQLKVIAENFIKSGGTREQWISLFDAANVMPGRGQLICAESSGHLSAAPTRQPVEDGVANVSVPDEGRGSSAPPSSSNRGGEGLLDRASDRRQDPALPVREPKPQRAAIDFGAASLAIKTKLANSVMDRIKIDGTAIGDYSPKRAQIEGAKKTREGYILREAARIALNVANPPSGATIRDLVKASEMESIEQAAKVLNDVA